MNILSVGPENAHIPGPGHPQVIVCQNHAASLTNTFLFGDNFSKLIDVINAIKLISLTLKTNGKIS